MNFRTAKCEHCDGTGFQMNHVKIGEHYRRKRDNAGVSVRALAAKLKVSAPFLSDLERGRRNWTDEWMQKYEKALK